MNRRQSDYLMSIVMVMSLVIFVVTSLIEINSVVHGQGVIVTEDNAQSISLLKGGTIGKIYVSEGSIVKKGDLLAYVVNLDLQKEYEQINVQREHLAINVKELSLILDVLQGERLPDIFSGNKLTSITNKELIANIAFVVSQIKTKELKISSLRSEISGLNEQYQLKNDESALLAEEIDILTPLVKKGVSPYTNFLNKKQEYIKIKAELNEIDNDITQKENEIGIITSDIESLDHELYLALAKQLSRESQELKVINSTLKIIIRQLEEEYIYSSINGVIYKINKNALTPDGVIQPADLLFEIKSIENSLLAEVKVSPKFRDQLFIGNPVKLNVISTIQTSAKTYDALIEKISPDTYEDNSTGATQQYYKVIVAFNANNDDLSILKPGMIVEANIITGRHRIIEYIISPLVKGIGRMFAETVYAT